MTDAVANVSPLSVAIPMFLVGLMLRDAVTLIRCVVQAWRERRRSSPVSFRWGGYRKICGCQ